MSEDIELGSQKRYTLSSFQSLIDDPLLIALENADIDTFVEILKNDQLIRYVDINRFYGFPYNGTLLDIACREKKSEFVNALVDYGVKIKTVNNLSGKAPIHCAVKNSDINTIKVLLKKKSVGINFKDCDGNAALHIATMSKDLKMIDVLFGHGHIDVNKVNGAGQTALHLALEQGNINTIRFLLTHPFIKLNILNNDGISCRRILADKYPEIENDVGNYDTFFTLFPVSDFEESCKRYLQYACEWGRTDRVHNLIELGMNPNLYHSDADPPAFIAAYYGHYDILRILISLPYIKLESVNGKNVLHCIFDGLTAKKWKCDKTHNFFKCLELLLTEIKRLGLDINYSNSDGNTILHRAAYFNDGKFVKIILHTKNVSLVRMNKRNEYALQLIEPSLLEECLNNCISTHHYQSRDKSYALIFCYSKFVYPAASGYSNGVELKLESLCETDPLMKMSAVPELRRFLKHPVFTSFLYLKWRIIRKYFYINLILYLAFWVALTAHILCMYGLATDRNVTKNDTNSKREMSASTTASLTWSCSWSITLIFYVILCIRALLQFIVSPRDYSKTPDKWLEISLIIATGVMLIRQTYSHHEEQLASFVVLLSWSKAILSMGKHPKLSTYIEMFKKISCNFLTFLLWYSILILAFALSFYILFNDVTQKEGKFFRTYWKSIFKSFVMMTGEFEADDSIPFDNHPIWSHFIFLMFIFLIAIVLYSLLNGLAVSDIQNIRADAEIVGIEFRMKVVHCFENATQILKKKLKIEKELFGITLYPDILPLARVYVMVNRGNRMTFYPKFVFRHEVFSTWKMDADIVKTGIQIVEMKNNPNGTPNFEELIEEYSRLLNEYKLKLETVEKTSRSNEKLLTECSLQLQEYRLKFEEISQSNEKLLMRVMAILKKKL